MGTMDVSKQELDHPRYVLEYYVTNDDDDDTRFKVRRNGKVFHILLSPSEFVNSPVTTKKYLSYLEVLRSGEQVIGDIYDTDLIDWTMELFDPLLAELAPSPVSPTNITVTLKEYLFPSFFTFTLDVINEKLQPRRIESKHSPVSASPYFFLDDDFLDDVEQWTPLYDPAEILLSPENPEDALFKTPGRVLIDNGQTGLLLTYIDHNGHTLSTKVDHDKPEATLAELHRAGIVWGDVKADNVLVDREDNVWIIDFGGGHTEGWVDREMEGTIAGDLAGMAKLREFIFQDEAQGPPIGLVEGGDEDRTGLQASLAA